jgi:hypothetical protein
MVISGSARTPAHATSTGTVDVLPANVTVGLGDSFQVAISAEVPHPGFTLWTVVLTYDPLHLQLLGTPASPACYTASLPPAGVGASTIVYEDHDFDQVKETIVIIGGYIENVGGNAVGLTGPVTLAHCNFVAVGLPDYLTPLSLGGGLVDPDSNNIFTIANGAVIHIVESTPVGGTVTIVSSPATHHAGAPYLLAGLIPAVAATAWLLRRRIMRR